MRITRLLAGWKWVTWATAFAISHAAWAENWPQFRGSSGQGISTEKDLPTSWDIKTGQNILWKAPLPLSDNPFSSPIAWGDRVFITLVMNKTREHHLLCFDARDGRKLWDTSIAPGPWVMTDLRGGYGAPTPATDGQAVFVLFGSAVLAAVDLDGQIIWRTDLKNYAFDVAIGTSPILYKDTVILLSDLVDKKSSLIGFDKKTGKVRWEEPRPTVGFSHSTPVPVQIQGKPQLLIAASNALQGADPENGRILWHCSAAGDAASPVYSPAANRVYIDSGRGSVGIAVDPTGVGDVTRTHLKWKLAKIIPESLSSAVIVGEHLYRAHPPGVLKCIQMPTGQEVYSQRLEGLSCWSSPVVTADGLIYLASPDVSYVIKAGLKPEVVSVNRLNDPNYASAAVCNGRIFLKGRNNLYCVAKR